MLEKDRLEQSLRFAQHIRKDRLIDEKELVSHKWFDYRFDTPLDATEKFAEAYSTVFIDKWAEYYDRGEATKKRPIPAGGIVHSRRELTCFWAARQKADLAGVPYDFFVREAINWHFRSAWKRIPRPNQLACNSKGSRVLEHIHSEWEKVCAARFHYSRLPQYRNENFSGFAAQIAHRDHVVRQINARTRPVELIGRMVFGEQILPKDMAARSFGEDILEEAKQTFTGPALPTTRLSNDEVRPSCYMLPYTHDASSSTCATCPIGRRCGAAAGLINAQIQKRCGELDPVTARERLLNRERVARHRAKKKAPTMALSA